MKRHFAVLMLLGVFFSPNLEREVASIARAGGMLPPVAEPICGVSVQSQCQHNNGGVCKQGAKFESAVHQGVEQGNVKQCDSITGNGSECLNSFVEAMANTKCDPEPKAPGT